jgi:hypothetical protein
VANSFQTPKQIGTTTLPSLGARNSLFALASGPKPAKPPKVTDRYNTEVGQEELRTTGVSKRLVRGYATTSPARYLPRNRSLSLRRLMGGKKTPTGIA